MKREVISLTDMGAVLEVYYDNRPNVERREGVPSRTWGRCGRAELSYVSWGVHGVGNTSHMGMAWRNMTGACMCAYMHGDGAEGLL